MKEIPITINTEKISKCLKKIGLTSYFAILIVGFLYGIYKLIINFEENYIFIIILVATIYAFYVSLKESNPNFKKFTQKKPFKILKIIIETVSGICALILGAYLLYLSYLNFQISTIIIGVFFLLIGVLSIKDIIKKG